jgi:hypothetical protein
MLNNNACRTTMCAEQQYTGWESYQTSQQKQQKKKMTNQQQIQQQQQQQEPGSSDIDRLVLRNKNLRDANFIGVWVDQVQIVSVSV